MFEVEYDCNGCPGDNTRLVKIFDYSDHEVNFFLRMVTENKNPELRKEKSQYYERKNPNDV